MKKLIALFAFIAMITFTSCEKDETKTEVQTENFARVGDILFTATCDADDADAKSVLYQSIYSDYETEFSLNYGEGKVKIIGETDVNDAFIFRFTVVEIDSEPVYDPSYDLHYTYGTMDQAMGAMDAWAGYPCWEVQAYEDDFGIHHLDVQWGC